MPLDITGEEYGLLTAVRNTGRKVRGGCIWEFECECGNTEERELTHLRRRRGNPMCKPCALKCAVIRKTTHGKSINTSVYRSWQSIKARCFNPKSVKYPAYGAKGITMYQPWVDSFSEFRDYLGDYPDNDNKYTVDRIDNTKNYCPGNLRWANSKQQARNKGLYSSSSTGVSGVTLLNRGKTDTSSLFYRARWITLDSKEVSKLFSVNKYGDELAFFLACTYREHQIDLLNLQGAGYAKDHGKAGYNARGLLNEQNS